ncbi:hypothetical protein FDK13_28955 [Dyadobacter frigoris]|uniref:Rhodanese domain-containing protein n=1 Tax=Dyadobacter frigoris TaxID=2576211 RepID=A0A4U6CWU9_9BACT|nr:hypothetical protein FDK13_28955 [Dyadobacter frigoris]
MHLEQATRNAVILPDIRPFDEYEMGHITGAIPHLHPKLNEWSLLAKKNRSLCISGGGFAFMQTKLCSI